MKRATIAGAAFVAVLILVALVLAVGRWVLEQRVDPAAATSSEITPSITSTAAENHPAAETHPVAVTHPAAENHQGFLYGRITTADGATYEGRLRWGGGEEAFWGDYFNGSKEENPWADPTGLTVGKSGDDVVMSWSGSTEIGPTWNVYRDAAKNPATWGGPHAAGVVDEDPGSAGVQYTDVGGVTAAPVSYYLVTEVTCGESPLR